MKKLALLIILCFQTGCATQSPSGTSSVKAAGVSMLRPLEGVQSINEFNFFMDKNGDQILSPSEFESAVIFTAHPLYSYKKQNDFDNVIKKYFDTLDADKNGKLSLKEASGEAIYQLYFDLQDSNKDGYLADDEFKDYEGQGVRSFKNLDALPIVDVIGYDQALHLEMFDRDADQRISQEEYFNQNAF